MAASYWKCLACSLSRRGELRHRSVCRIITRRPMSARSQTGPFASIEQHAGFAPMSRINSADVIVGAGREADSRDPADPSFDPRGVIKANPQQPARRLRLRALERRPD
jgi:hypothetical protein